MADDDPGDSLYRIDDRLETTWFTYPRAILGLCSIGWLLIQGGRLILPALALPIKQEIGIGNAEFGFALTVLWSVYALLQFPGGMASDDLGYKTVLVGSSVGAGVGFLVLSGAVTYPLFLLASTVIGVGVGLFYIASRTFPSTLYGQKKGWALGVTNAAGDAGGVIFPAAATVIISLALSWRAGFAVLGITIILLAVSFHYTVDDTYRFQAPHVRDASRSAIDQIIDPSVLVTLAVYSMFALVWQGAVAFIPLYMHEAKGLSFGTGSMMLSLFFLMGVIVKPISGRASDILGRRKLAIGSLFSAGCALAWLALFVDTGRAAVVALALFGLTLMVFPPVTQAYLIDIFAQDSVASAFGLSRTLYVLIGSLGPTVIGLGSEFLTYDLTFALLAGGLVIAAGVLFAIVPPDSEVSSTPS